MKVVGRVLDKRVERWRTKTLTIMDSFPFLGIGLGLILCSLGLF